MADIDMQLRVSTNDADGLLLDDIIQILDISRMIVNACDNANHSMASSRKVGHDDYRITLADWSKGSFLADLAIVGNYALEPALAIYSAIISTLALGRTNKSDPVVIIQTSYETGLETNDSTLYLDQDTAQGLIRVWPLFKKLARRIESSDSLTEAASTVQNIQIRIRKDDALLFRDKHLNRAVHNLTVTDLPVSVVKNDHDVVVPQLAVSSKFIDAEALSPYKYLEWLVQQSRNFALAYQEHIDVQSEFQTIMAQRQSSHGKVEVVNASVRDIAAILDQGAKTDVEHEMVQSLRKHFPDVFGILG